MADTVKMQPSKQEQDSIDLTKLSKEQLIETIKKQDAIIKNMYGELTNRNNIFKRLDYLFKVVDPSMLSDEFRKDCAKEIEDLIRIPKTNE